MRTVHSLSLKWYYQGVTVLGEVLTTSEKFIFFHQLNLVKQVSTTSLSRGNRRSALTVRDFSLPGHAHSQQAFLSGNESDSYG